MNDRPSSGHYPDNGYDGLSTTTFAGDPGYGTYETQAQGLGATGGFTGGFTSYDPYGTATGAYDSSAWASAIPNQASAGDTTGQWGYAAPVAADHQQTAFAYDASGQWAMPGFATETGAYDATAWNTAGQAEQPQQFAYGTGYQTEYDAGGAYGTGFSDPYTVANTDAHQADYGTGTGYGTDHTAGHTAPQAAEYAGFEGYAEYADPSAQYASEYGQQPQPTAVFEVITPEHDGHDGLEDHDAPAEPLQFRESDAAEDESGDESYDADAALHAAETRAMPRQAAGPDADPGPRAARRAAGKGGSRNVAKTGSKAAGANRRRTPAKRSALLTVAVPSVCVMGVAGVAAASVGGLTGGEKPAEEVTSLAASDPSAVKPVAVNNKLDTQLTALSADAGDFADRASRTQERIDLKVAQEEARKKAAEEAARKELLRPKFALPVAQHGLSAGFGQAGGMWMSVHTGIDFPVSYGTPVMSATDGVVRTQWNSAYGNMAIVTSPDGTETWYCHLSSTKIRSGKVKAGDVIAYSGNSGNSTGPHLHFEVRPGGGGPIDPSAWLRKHGLNPN
ncbi:peptidoglycan DD-metalloendopeptidase family protein [Streptomyces sp. NPDC089799]|uniref:peptidoglycan DD-metalloendopeptidase family protein n=1 Tax=Streptomyces sp. NPDC089799 TaxID=3155066 RepID=UPI00341A860A